MFDDAGFIRKFQQLRTSVDAGPHAANALASLVELVGASAKVVPPDAWQLHVKDVREGLKVLLAASEHAEPGCPDTLTDPAKRSQQAFYSQPC